MRRKILLVILSTCFWGPASTQQVVPDYHQAHILITPDPVNESIDGEVRYRFTLAATADSLRLDAQNMVIHGVELDGSPVAFRQTSGKLLMNAPDQAGAHHLRIHYSARPAEGVYFIGWQDGIAGNEQIWTQGQGKDSSHWVPVVDQMEEKVEFDLSVRFDPGFSVIANGKLQGRYPDGSLQRWDFNMENPMSSYLLAFAVGRFDKLEWTSDSGVLLEGYYPEGADKKAHWTYRYTPEIFNFLEATIGVPYPWADYKQVPVRDFLYAGMENTGATFFSERYLVDSLGYNDENYINVNAHELAHQWFGNLVTETGPSEHWLHEGFATFYAYEAERSLTGADQVHWKLYDTARALEDRDASGSGESLLDPGASSLTFYEKGAWALYMLREEVGETAFQRGVKDFLRAHAYSNATVDDFLRSLEKASGVSLSGFRETWLKARRFAYGPAMDYLIRNSPSVKAYLGLLEARKKGEVVGEPKIARVWEEHNSPELRAHLLETFRAELTPSFLQRVCGKGALAVQKAFLATTKSMEAWMVPMVEEWLDAPSYDLREAALFRLWVSDPAGRKAYLDRVAGNGSLSKTRLQQFWWLLAIVTEGYGTPEEKQAYLQNLRQTTSPAYPWEVRQQAFSMLEEAGGLDKENLRDLMQATEHHAWQFKKYARALLETILETRPGGTDWNALAEAFPEAQYRYLHEILEKR